MIEIIFAALAFAAVAIVAAAAPGVIRDHRAWKRKQAAGRRYRAAIVTFAAVFEGYIAAIDEAVEHMAALAAPFVATDNGSTNKKETT